MKNWLDPAIKRNYSTHSVSTIIENTLTFVANNTRKLLFMSIKLNLDWSRIDRQREGNKQYQNGLQKRPYLH